MQADAWDWEFVFTSGPVIVLDGVGVTILLSVASIIFATILALFGALGRLSPNPILNAVASFYVSLVRGTPLLVQIFFDLLRAAAARHRAPGDRLRASSR